VTEHDHDAVTRASFERQVGLFTGDDSVFARHAVSLLAWVEPLEPGMIVLDVACGAAHVAEQVAPRVRQVVGIDLTPALLALGAERLRDAGVRNVLLQEGDAAALPFVDGSFDLVLCRAALHHFARPEVQVAEMARVCRSDGRVVISDMVVTSADVRDAFDALHRQLDPSHAAVLLDDELAELARTIVGPVVRAETSEPANLPVEHIFHDASNRDAVRSALAAELAGGPATGFHPSLDGDQVLVSFTNTVVHATRA
jgi:ubiquinone/menaquinone biosynthesis C-methylase UbiE